MATRRGTSNTNVRGNTRDRLMRRKWLVSVFRANVDAITPRDRRGGVAHGSGIPACRCYRCGALLTVVTVTVDRIVPGCQGGTYRRDNIRPACANCNSETGATMRRTA